MQVEGYRTRVQTVVQDVHSTAALHILEGNEVEAVNEHRSGRSHLEGTTRILGADLVIEGTTNNGFESIEGAYTGGRHGLQINADRARIRGVTENVNQARSPDQVFDVGETKVTVNVTSIKRCDVEGYTCIWANENITVSATSEMLDVRESACQASGSIALQIDRG